jgi:hypothetical protein
MATKSWCCAMSTLSATSCSSITPLTDTKVNGHHQPLDEAKGLG